VARPKRTLPKSFNHKLTDEEIEEIEIADLLADAERREWRESQKYKRAQEIADGFSKRRDKRKD
jgi:hypothetical protein